MTHSRAPVRAVADTAAVTALCRALDAEDEAGLLHDVFAARFVTDLRAARRAFDELVGDRRDYVVARAHVFDVLLMDAVRSGARVLWHLGAGYDCRPYRLELPEDFVTIEVDAPEVLAKKDALLAGERPRGVVHRLPGDLAGGRKLVETLTREHPPTNAVVALTEGVTPYLSANHLRALAAALAPVCGRWLTDVVGAATARSMGDRLGRSGAGVGVYGLDSFAPFTERGWVVERLVPLLAAIRRLRPDSPAARIIATQAGLVDSVAALTASEN